MPEERTKWGMALLNSSWLIRWSPLPDHAHLFSKLEVLSVKLDSAVYPVSTSAKMA